MDSGSFHLHNVYKQVKRQRRNNLIVFGVGVCLALVFDYIVEDQFYSNLIASVPLIIFFTQKRI